MRYQMRKCSPAAAKFVMNLLSPLHLLLNTRRHVSLVKESQQIYLNDMNLN